MARINLKKQIVDIVTGVPVADFNIGKAIVQALTATNPNEQASGQEKFDRYKLALRVTDGDDCEFSVEELALIKKCVGVAYGPGVVGPVYLAIEAMSTGDGENKPPRP